VRRTRVTTAWLLLPLAVALAGARSVPAASETPAQRRAARERLRVVDYRVQELALPARGGAPFAAALEVDGRRYTLDLAPWSGLRAGGLRVRVQGADGRIRAVEPPAPAGYRGRVRELAGSWVTARLGARGLSAVIRPRAGELWALEPLHGVVAGVPRSRHALYESRDALVGTATCAALPSAPGTPPPGALQGGGGCTAVTELAFDADVEFFEACSSSTDEVVERILLHLDAVDAIFRADVDVAYVVTDVLIRTAEPDPYDATDAAALRAELQQEWNTAQSAIDRDVAHLVTGKDLDGSTVGTSFIGTVCQGPPTGESYSLTQLYFPLGDLTHRVGLLAHELGHNWSAVHCQGTPSDCNIMWPDILGAPAVDSFAAGSAALIAAHRDASSCFNDLLVVKQGALPPFLGTPAAPFDSVAGGVACAAPGATLLIAPGTYPEAGLTIDEPVTLRARSGAVVIE